MRISSSDINGFLECRRRWDYSSDNRQRLEPLKVAPALFLGTGVHEALEAYYRGDADDLSQRFEAWAAEQMGIWDAEGVWYDPAEACKTSELGIEMLQGYQREYGPTPADDPDVKKMIATEQQIQVPIPGTDGGLFVGRIDGLMLDHRGLAWIFETKTYREEPREFSHILQQIAYVWAANRLSKAGAFKHLGLEPGRRIYGTLYNGLRKMKPGPRVTKPLFKRAWVDRTLLQLYLFEKDLARYYRAMSDPNLEIFPTYAKSCSWCSYKSPCTARSMGDDEEYILEHEFRRAESRGEVYQDALEEAE